jgi:hypothetical protein
MRPSKLFIIGERRYNSRILYYTAYSIDLESRSSYHTPVDDDSFEQH